MQWPELIWAALEKKGGNCRENHKYNDEISYDGHMEQPEVLQ
jgi:hypothetical protein